MIYLLVVGHEYVDKNKLDAKMKELIKAKDRQIFRSEEEIKEFLAKVKAEAEAYAPRCKPIELYAEFDRWDSKKDWVVRGGMGLSAEFYAFDGLRQAQPDSGAAQPYSKEKERVDGGLKVTDNLIIRVIEPWEMNDDETVVIQVRILFRFYGEEAEVFLDTETIDVDDYPKLIQTETVSDLADSFNDQLEDEWEAIKELVIENLCGYQAEI